MFPEVPMALRISSYLLLGVVRIYSKKVDYILHDHNLRSTRLLAKSAFVSNEVDLPEDARQAPVELVTFPKAFNLDDFDLEDDDDTLDNMEFDSNLRWEEDITLTDQIPTGIDPYVAITFDEDIIPESSPMDIESQSTLPARETDVEMAYEEEPNNVLGGSNVGLDTETCEFQDPRPINLTEELNLSTERSHANSPGSVPDIEKRRDAAHSLSPPSHQLFPLDEQSVRAEHTEPLDESLNEKETTFPNIDEEVLNSRGHLTFELRSGSPSLARSEEEHANFVHPSPQLALQPTPPPKTQTRPRKRKHFDNKATVLTNKVMKKRLEDPSDAIRKRKKMPASKVGLWRLHNQSKKDQIFNEPLFTGFSNVLRSVFEKDCVSSKPYLAVSVSDDSSTEPESISSPSRETETEINPTSPIPQSSVPDSTNPDSTLQLSPGRETEDVQDYAVPHSECVAREAQSPQTFIDDDIEIERLRDGGFPNYMMSTPLRSSPYRTDDFTTGTSEIGAFRTEPSNSTNQEDHPGLRNSRISASPEMKDKEHYFPDVSGNIQLVRSSASQDPDALPERTRAVAQDLKERFLSSPASGYPSGDLSLSKILAGKTRKLAAQMFFETLVLKSRGLIDVQQDQPYSDIALKLMPALFAKVQI